MLSFLFIVAAIACIASLFFATTFLIDGEWLVGSLTAVSCLAAGFAAAWALNAWNAEDVLQEKSVCAKVVTAIYTESNECVLPDGTVLIK